MSLGGDWKVTRKAYGALVCSTVTWWNNCKTKDSWRLFVWMDGACEKLKNDYSKCRFTNTKAGHYYGGYAPCKTGDLVNAGIWIE